MYCRLEREKYARTRPKQRIQEEEDNDDDEIDGPRLSKISRRNKEIERKISNKNGSDDDVI